MAISREKLDHAKSATQQIYQDCAKQWDEQRPRNLYERKWLDRFAESLPASSSILDLGCGAGEPVSEYLIEQGFRLTGVDYSQSMIEIAATRFPKHDWLVQDIRNLQLERPFDGIVSWDGFFHLSQDEQRRFFKSLAELLNDNAVLLFTIGTGNGEVTGTVAGQTVYHASLEPDEYRQIMTAHGFGNIEIVIEDQDALGRSVLFATK